MTKTLWNRAASIVLALETAALVVIVVGQVAGLVTGQSFLVDSGIALTVLSALGAALLGVFSVAVWRARSFGRSGGIVAQLLIVAVAIGAATGTYAHPLEAAFIALPGVVGFVLLILAAREAHGSPDGDA